MSGENRGASPIEVVAICGSLRERSYTRMALRIALRGAEELGAQTQLVDLRDHALVFCDGGETYPQDVARLRTAIKNAQGILLGTPVYHGSFSGALKNALDLMGFAEFEGKIVGLVGTAGGKAGAISALDNLRTVGQALHAWVVPDEVSIPEAWRVFDESGAITNRNIEERLLEVGRQVARFAYLHLSEQAQEFLKLWESAAENPGGS